jgi:hypothetical protein
MYEISVEVRPLAGCTVACDREGAYAYVYVPAEDLEESIELMKQALHNDKLELLDIEFCTRLYFDEWDADEDYHPTLAELRAAIDSGAILYSPFYSYESHYEH